jgi:hypothetical protein
MTDIAWQLEHSVEAAVSASFAWKFWTNVTNWDDPPAQFVLDGPFVAGSTGTTLLPGQDPLRWRIRDVLCGRSATIEMQLDRATLSFTWLFDEVADRRTNLTQHIVLSGKNAPAYIQQVQEGLGSNLRDGMKKVAEAMARAETAAPRVD